MATIKIYLDKRSLDKLGNAPLKIGINKQGSSAYIPLNVKVRPSQWDAKREKVKDHPNKVAIQSYIDAQKGKVANLVMKLTSDGELAKLTATQVKNKVAGIIDPTPSASDSFFNRFVSFTNTKSANRTQEIYKVTVKYLLEFDKQVRTKTFEAITKEWLTRFDCFLVEKGLSVNTRSIHFRNIRAVFNDALDNGITASYPFRVFKIKNEQTEKRSLTVEQLRCLFDMTPSVELQKTLDLFKLIFFLIGINIADLCRLDAIGEDGRIVYKRQKTNKLYSIKVEPEALEIINKYRGKRYLLDILDEYANVHNFTVVFDRKLKKLMPRLTSYYARHTWATLASEIDVPTEVISHALGHSFSMGASVTQIYINFNQRKVDDANRKVLDFVLKGK